MNKNENIIGKKFHCLTAIKFEFRDKWSSPHWLFLCECGVQKVINLNPVSQGITKSCGCITKKDWTGVKFGKLIGIKFIKNENGKAHWLWKCDCGKEKELRAKDVVSGNTSSCGCIGKGGAHRLPKGESAFNRLFRQYKYKAEKDGLVFELIKDETKTLTSSTCYYCGIAPYQKIMAPGGNGNYVYNGLDRIDNTKGYTLDNTVACCGRCNVAKNDMSVLKFKELISRIYNNFVR